MILKREKVVRDEAMKLRKMKRRNLVSQIRKTDVYKSGLK